MTAAEALKLRHYLETLPYPVNQREQAERRYLSDKVEEIEHELQDWLGYVWRAPRQWADAPDFDDN